MPATLRARKYTVHGSAGQSYEVPSGRRRSRRLLGRRAPPVEENEQETEDSDTESVRSQVMEDEERTTPRPEEDDRGQTATNPMFCSVVLDRLKLEEITAGKELEEKEDMNRKSGKQSISRIPTFQSTKKRPISGSHSTELQLPPKDIPSDAAEPQPKAGSGAVEVPKSRLYGITALPLPTARLPSKVASEAPSISHTEQAALSTDDTLTSASQESGWMAEPVHVGVMVTPRPAIRVDQGDRALEKEADLAQDLIPHPPSFSQTLQVDAADMWEVDVGEGIHLSASGDTENLESEEAIGGDGENVSQVQAIMDEEPPWEAEPVKSDFVLEEEDSSSSSDIQHIDDPPVEKWAFGGVGESGEVNGSQKQNISLQNVPPKSTTLPEDSSDTDEPTISAVLHEPVKASQSTRRSSCPNFGFCFLLPITLLLLGGFGQHVWQYGLPMSVAHLTAQLELHWLEGIGLVEEPCGSDCRVRLVESVPEDLFYSDPLGLSSISDSWLHLLKEANSSVRIAAFYFTLRNTDVGLTQPTDSQGRKVLDQLKELKAKAVKLQIAVNTPQSSSQDTSELAATGAEIREVDLQSVTGGIVHTKLWVVDQKHIYLGSANMDWRSLSQVKEVGISVEDCSCLAQDAHRIFEVYWNIGAEKNGSLPPYWPARLSALSSSQRPLHLKFNGVPSRVYLSSAPSLISTRGRTDDLSSILSVIADAQKFIHISVMDYLPLSQFTKPLRFWPAIDSAIRAAACTRGVEVKLLVSCWQHSPLSMFVFLQSLLVLNRPPLGCDINVKVFTVHSTAEQRKIPFARVNHAKYMVTDRVVYIGTSNWSENYFTQTAGVGLVVNQTGAEAGEGQETLQRQVEALFLRDWASQYARTLSPDEANVCPRD